MYSVNTACDENNFVLDLEVTSGNIHDSVTFPRLYENLKRKYSDFKRVVVDAGYKIPVMPYKRPMTKDGFFKKHEYVYDEFYDCYICPNDEILRYSTTNREGYKEYKSDCKVCEKCNFKNKCTESKNSTKVVTRHVWESYLEQTEDIRHTQGIKEIYALRSQTIERVFADAKELHGMRYTHSESENGAYPQICMHEFEKISNMEMEK